MGMFLFVVLLGALGWWAYNTGIVDSAMINFQPVIGKKCVMRAPVNGKLYLSNSEDTLGFIIQAVETKSTDPMEDAAKLSSAIDRGMVVEPENNARVEVVERGEALAGRIPYACVKVNVLSGRFAGKAGWIRRENLIDTPLQEFFSLFH